MWGPNSIEQPIMYAAVGYHDDVIKWKHFPRYWPFVRGIHRSPVNSPHKCQWRGALMFSMICVWINGWVKNREAGDLRRYRAHYDVTVMRYERCVVGHFYDTTYFYLRFNLHLLCSWRLPLCVGKPKYGSVLVSHGYTLGLHTIVS